MNKKVKNMLWDLLFKTKLKFAKTPEDIMRVYNSRNIKSCMTGSPAVQAYSRSDLSVAYTERLGKIKARSVVWPEKKLYTRVYGKFKDRLFLEHSLVGLGYRHSRRFKGAKIERFAYYLPSLDCAAKGVQYRGHDVVIL